MKQEKIIAPSYSDTIENIFYTKNIAFYKKSDTI